MGEVRVFDYGKNKKNKRFEASFALDVQGPTSNFVVSANGFGADEAEARLELNVALRMLEKEIRETDPVPFITKLLKK